MIYISFFNKSSSVILILIWNWYWILIGFRINIHYHCVSISRSFTFSIWKFANLTNRTGCRATWSYLIKNVVAYFWLNTLATGVKFRCSFWNSTTFFTNVSFSAKCYKTISRCFKLALIWLNLFISHFWWYLYFL